MKALLIRHATSSHQAPDAPLAPEGYEQAQALVRTLTGLRAGPLYTSPYRRAQETIRPYSEISGQQLVVLENLRERRLSRAPLDNFRDHIALSFDDPDHAGPGGESHRDLRARANAALGEIAARGGARPAFVTHGNFTAALFSEIDPNFGFDDWQAMRNPDVFDVTLRSGRLMDFARIELEMHA